MLSKDNIKPGTRVVLDPFLNKNSDKYTKPVLEGDIGTILSFDEKFNNHSSHGGLVVVKWDNTKIPDDESIKEFRYYFTELCYAYDIETIIEQLDNLETKYERV